MLGIAVALQLMGVGVIFALGGTTLGLAVVGVTALIFVIWLTMERRQLRVARPRHGWRYYAVNDRLNAPLQARRGLPQHSRSAHSLSPLGWLSLTPLVSRSYDPRRN
jgi:hypothetical protein